MRQFNSPPGWPDPPTSRWRPPRRWRPPATWPKAPRSWSFWIDENGRAVRGPIGRYGGPGITLTAAIVLIPLALMAVVIVNPLRNGESVSTVPSIATSSARPKSAATTKPTTAPTGGTPSPLSAQATPSSSTTSSSPTASPTDPTSTAVTPTPGTTSSAPTVPNPTVVPVTAAPPKAPQSTTAPTPTPTASTTTVVFKNCDEARAAGKAPLHRGDPGYSPALDHNGDGVACGDRGNS